MYQPRPHLSQMHTTICRPFTQKKGGFLERKNWANKGGGGGRPHCPPPPLNPPLNLPLVVIACILVQQAYFVLWAYTYPRTGLSEAKTRSGGLKRERVGRPLPRGFSISSVVSFSRIKSVTTSLCAFAINNNDYMMHCLPSPPFNMSGSTVKTRSVGWRL